MEVSEKVRISQQADSLGKEGLKRKSEELDKAVVQNEVLVGGACDSHVKYCVIM